MNIFIEFFIVSIPAVISFLILSIYKNKTDEIFLKYDKEYVSKRNSNNFIRIVKTYKKSNVFEKRHLILMLFFTLVIYLTVIVWGILCFFFPDIMFRD